MKNTIIVFTSNIGAAQAQSEDDPEAVRNVIASEVKRYFTEPAPLGIGKPELYSRLNGSIVVFNRLSEPALQHIFEKQVFGLAPTEIIYKIAISFILGFTDEIEIKKHNFRQADALPYAKEGRLDELLEKLYGEGTDE